MPGNNRQTGGLGRGPLQACHPEKSTGFSLSSVDGQARRRGGEHVCAPHLHHEVRDGGCGGHLSKENQPWLVAQVGS